MSAWIAYVFLIVLVIGLLDLLHKKLLVRLIAGAEGSKNIWDDILVYSLRKPIRLLIWVLGCHLIVDILLTQTSAGIFQVFSLVGKLGFIISLAWFLSNLIREIERHTIEHKLKISERLDETATSAISKILLAAVYITTVLVLLQSSGFSISGVLAFGGVGGIAVGFAARDLLANFFGGLMIYMDRPFVVGDWVRSPDKEIEGIVEHIGWRLTRIRRFDRRPLYVPNSLFNTISLENPSRMLNRRIHETIGIRYDDLEQMHHIVEDVKAMLREHPDIDQNQVTIVAFDRCSESSLDFFVYTYTKTTAWVKFHTVKQDVMLRVLQIIQQHGAQCAFPTSTLHIKSSTPPPFEDRMR